MCTAVERLGVDAAIIFSDLLPILEPMGMDLEFAHGEGPVIHNPVREPTDVDRVVELEERRRPALRDGNGAADAGRPAGQHSADRLCRCAVHAGQLRHRRGREPQLSAHQDADVPRPGGWDALMSRLARSVAVYLNAQIAAGAQAVQLFDSWVGCLGPDDYRRFVLPLHAGRSSPSCRPACR